MSNDNARQMEETEPIAADDVFARPDSETGQLRDVGGVSMRTLSILAVVLACIATVVFLLLAGQTSSIYKQHTEETASYTECQTAADQMKESSNYMTAQVRQFVITHDVDYLDRYLTEVAETHRRDEAVSVLERHLPEKDAYRYLKRSLELSDDLRADECYAAKLVLVATGQEPTKGAEELLGIGLSMKDQALSADGKLQKAMQMLFGDAYQNSVDDIEENVALCKASLIDDIKADQARNQDTLGGLLLGQQILILGILAVVLVVISSLFRLVLRPMQSFMTHMAQNKGLPLSGARELRLMADEYNRLHEQNLLHSDELRRKAEYDHLTGLFNREVFESLLHTDHNEPIALILLDVDRFKDVNDTYGHDCGDKILQKIAGALLHTFRSTDYACRIGGDEFAVVMTQMTPDLETVIMRKIEVLNQILSDTSDGLPAMTLSIGVAFNAKGIDYEGIYKHADEALYRVKEAGRNGYAFY